MSKKRFVKLMMARGYSRNGASALALLVPQYGSYTALYKSILSMGKITEAVKILMNSIYSGLATVFECAAEAFQNVANTLRRAHDEQEETTA